MEVTYDGFQRRSRDWETSFDLGTNSLDSLSNKRLVFVLVKVTSDAWDGRERPIESFGGKRNVLKAIVKGLEPSVSSMGRGF